MSGAALLVASLLPHQDHHFRRVDVSLLTSAPVSVEAILASRRVTDTDLLALAVHHDVRPVRLDRWARHERWVAG